MGCEFRDKSVMPCRYYIKDQYCSLPDQFLCLEARQRKAPRISYSELRTYCQCYYRWYLSYVNGLELINPPIRLLAGKIMSDCLDCIMSTNPSKSGQEIINSYESYKDEDDEFPRELLMIQAWCKAMENMEWTKEKGNTQYEFKWQDLEYPQIHGFLDWIRFNADGDPSYGREFKYSTHDNWSKFQVYNQLGTYFIPFPTLQRIELIVLKVPTLKWMRKGKNEESAEEFSERVYKDIIHNQKSYVFKTNYWRSEFNLESIKGRYRTITREMYDRMKVGKDAFWQTDNRIVCFSCDYLQICENDGLVSEQLYRKRERKDENEDNR